MIIDRWRCVSLNAGLIWWSLPSCYRHVFDTRCGWLSAATEAHTHAHTRILQILILPNIIQHPHNIRCFSGCLFCAVIVLISLVILPGKMHLCISSVLCTMYSAILSLKDTLRIQYHICKYLCDAHQYSWIAEGDLGHSTMEINWEMWPPYANPSMSSMSSYIKHYKAMCEHDVWAHTITHKYNICIVSYVIHESTYIYIMIIYICIYV